VKPTGRQYLTNRVFKINVGFLLSAGSGNFQDSRLDIPTAVKISDDLIVNAITGSLRLTRAKEGILVQSQLNINVDNQCSRCVDTVVQDVELEIEELFAHPETHTSEFAVGGDAILDLAPLLRDEILIEMSHKILCRPECKGLCPECGTNWNHETCNCADNHIDPRMAALKNLLNKN
jgi:uncharacterized protein